MSELLRVKTGSGMVTITEDTVTLSRNGGNHTERMLRSAITAIDCRTTVMSTFGMGGAKKITLRGQANDLMVMTFVKPKDAKAILAILKL